MKRFLLAVLCFPVCAFADVGLPNQPYIYVEGNGKIQRAPDMVTLTFSLGAFDHELAAAAKKVQKQAAKVFALLDGEKVAQKDVVAESIRWQTETEDGSISPGKHEAKGYAVSRDFSVVVRDVGEFPRVVDGLLALGVESFSAVEAGLSDQEALSDEVHAKAMANAREQAGKTLQEEKMKVDSVYAVSSLPFTQIQGDILQENPERVVVTGSNARPPNIDPAQFRLAPISVTQTVRVIYLISPAK